MSRILVLTILVVVGPWTAVSAQVDTGSADFSEFVALGDSLIAGEVNNVLVEAYQENSIPALIYKQVNDAEDASMFDQPLFGEPGDIGRLVLFLPDPVPVRLPGTGLPLNEDPSRPFDNLGMSGGVRVNDLLSITGLQSCLNHPLAMTKDCDRINETLQDRGSGVEQTNEQSPTFVFLWIGGNDALQAATTATVIEGVTLTPAASFEADYRAVTDSIVNNSGANLLLATVVSVAGIPFVNAVPPVVVDPDTREPVLIMGQTVPLFDGAGNLAATDRPTVFALPYLEAGCGIPDLIDGGFDPGLCADGALPDDVVLKEAEADQIDARIDEFNTVIRDVAQELGAALLDAHTLFDAWAADGQVIGGVHYSLDFLTGGLVGYDGIHPTPLTMGFAANECIRAINRTYGARIPLIDLNRFASGTEGCLVPLTEISEDVPPQCVPLVPIVPVQSGQARLESVRAGLGLPTREELELLVGDADAGPGPVRERRQRRRLDRGYR